VTSPSPDQQPTTVLPQTTLEQPTVITAPATRRARVWRHIPSRVGRARTSTLVIGCLFVLLLGLNAALPRGESGTTNVVLPSGQTVPVPNSALPSDPAPTPAPSPTTAATTSAPAAPTPATTTRPSRTSGTSTAPDEDERTTAPATTADEPGEEAPRSSSTPSAGSTPTSRAPSSSRASASTRAPATTAAPTSAEPTG
jgi:hypothetical protein